MQSKEECIQKMKQLLNEAFQPDHLKIEDESYLHTGHGGVPEGAGHYAIEIASSKFNGLSLLQQHRLVYDALIDLMNNEIHALRIKTISLTR